MTIAWQDLSKDFEKYKKLFLHLKQKLELNIVEKKYSKGPYYETYPFSYQRNRLKKGIIVNNISNLNYKNTIYEYGFDKNQNIIEVKRTIDLPNKFYYEFLLYNENIYKIISYDYNQKLQSISFCFFNKINILDSMYLKGRAGSKIENYFYNNKVLYEVRTRFFDIDNNELHTLIQRFEYDEKGALYQIIESPMDKNYTETIFLV